MRNYNEVLQRGKVQNDTIAQAHTEHFRRSQEIAKIGSYELDVSSGSFFTTDPVYWSDEEYRIFGYNPSLNLSRELFFNRVHPEDRHLLVAAMSAAMYGDGIFDVKHRLLMEDGSIKYVWQKGQILFNQATGRPDRLFGTTQDITAFRKSQEQLETANKELNTLFETMGEVFFSVDMEQMHLIQISRACEKVYGYSVEEFKSNVNLWYDVILNEDRHIIDSNNKFLFAGQPILHSYRIHQKNGAVRWLETNITPTLKDNKLVRIDGITSDITPRKEYENALHIANAELKKTNMELDRFVYTVSHDLRAPLSSMVGLIGLCEDEEDITTIREYLGLVKTSAEKLDAFIHDVLNYAKNARLEVKKEKVDFKMLIDNVVEGLRYMKHDAGVDIRINIQPDIQFYSDGERISILLGNLLSNAIRYYNRDAENPFVEVTVTTVDGRLELKVSDNGIGIDKESQEKVFDMFYRVSSASSGSGLGLYILKETTETLGGKIELESEPGKGTTFLITLPDGRSHENA